MPEPERGKKKKKEILDPKAKQIDLKDYLAMKSKIKNPTEDFSLNRTVKWIIGIPLFILICLILGYILYIRTVKI